MNEERIPKFGGIDPRDTEAVERVFARVAERPVGCCNWPDDYPYAPQVGCRMFHTGDWLLVRFEVAEQCTAARVAEDNGRVWTDSCVELFLAPEGEAGYYNFETTCIGRMLLGYRTCRDDARHAGEATMQQILRMPSLGTEPFDERTGDIRWRLTLAIPPAALFCHKAASWDGLDMRMNIYKCGDELSQPHFLSWRPIEWPKPNFHLPAFFGRVHFDETTQTIQ